MTYDQEERLIENAKEGFALAAKWEAEKKISVIKEIQDEIWKWRDEVPAVEVVRWTTYEEIHVKLEEMIKELEVL